MTENMRDIFNSRIKPRYKQTHVPQCAKCMLFKPWGRDYMEVHHIVPLINGGTNDDSNLIVLCRDCHKEWHEHMEERKDFRQWLQEAPGFMYAAIGLFADSETKHILLENAEIDWPTVREERMVFMPYRDDECRRYVRENCSNWVDW